MNENESNINTNDEDPSQINLKDIFPDINPEFNDNQDKKIIEDDNVIINRDFVPEDPETVPPTPEFSDGSDANLEKEERFINIPAPDYSKLFETYRQLFENLTEETDTINKKINKFSEVIDNNMRETNAAIKATQIYSKLFTKLSLGINIILLIAIIVLFIIK